MKIIQLMIEQDVSELRKAISKLHQEHLSVLMDFASQWNTNSRMAHVRSFNSIYSIHISVIFLTISWLIINDFFGKSKK